MLWTQLCFLWNPALHAKTPDCVPWDPPARRASSRHPDPCPQHSLSNPPPPNGMNTGFLNGVAQGDFRARGRRPPCRWGLRGAVQGQPGSSRGLQEDTGLHTRRVPTRGGGRARSTQARTVSTSRTLFERDGWLPSQAKPAGDTPAPRVGALTLLLLLQHLVPEVLVRGAAAGPLPLGKQIWECEGLPVCLGRKHTGSARDPRGEVPSTGRLNCPPHACRTDAQPEDRYTGQASAFGSGSHCCDRPFLTEAGSGGVSALGESSKAPTPGRSCQARLQARGQGKRARLASAASPEHFLSEAPTGFHPR